MVVLKKEVYDDLVRKMREEQQQIRARIRRNKHDMKKLATDQALHKRELAAIDAIIRNLEVKK